MKYPGYVGRTLELGIFLSKIFRSSMKCPEFVEYSKSMV
jgi:hypothetical protein